MDRREWKEKKIKYMYEGIRDQIEKEKAKENKRMNEAKNINSDTQLRVEIHGIIRRMVGQGETTQTIINTLVGNPKYSKYEVYFFDWIEDYRKKQERKEKSTQGKRLKEQKEDEER